MPNHYKRFVPGEAFSTFPGGSWNRLVEAARWVDTQRAKQVNEFTADVNPQSLTVVVRNASNEVLDTQAPILGIDTSTWDVADDESITSQPVSVDGIKPDEKKHRSHFAILQDPAAKDDLCVGIVAGYAWAEVTIVEVGDKLCGLKSDDMRYLHSGRPGAQIIWAENQDEEETEDQIGPQWCLILLNQNPPVYWLEHCESEEGILVSNDLAKHMDKVVVVGGECFTVKTPPESVNCWSAQCVKIEAVLEDCKECKGSGGGTCWKMTPCSTGSTWYARGSFGEFSGKVIRWSNDLCYTVTPSPTCQGAVTADPADIKSSFLNCANCDDCTELINCFDKNDKRYVRTDQIAGFPGAMLGKIITLNGICYTVNDIAFTCVGDPEDLGGIYAGETFTDCKDCGCHLFERCLTPFDIIAVSKATVWGSGGTELFDLESLEVGQAVTMNSQTAPVCRKYLGVDSSGQCEDPVEIEVLKTYDNCNCCSAWKLTECSGHGSEIVYTQDDLCEYYDESEPQGIIGGQILKGTNIDDFPDGKCFETLEKDITFSNGPNWREFIPEELHSTCNQCSIPIFRLVDADCAKEVCGNCDNGTLETPIITDEPLNDYIDQIIKYKGICWIVEEAPDETVTDPAPLDYKGPFLECEPCIIEPSCIEVVTDINWETKEVTYTKYAIPNYKCDEKTDSIPTAPCPS